ncbi:hypothetical protein [Xylanimonas sp. McL0601]|uniref:hypothetical protein n=1 Tax=Xylanimonas sp. McL0601 TaxID=3414739 RepID=UPI003CEE1C0B
MAGTWGTFNAPSGVSADTMVLLTDGTVLAHDANRPSLGQTYGGKNWYRLTPDSHGDYRNGSWSSALPMAGQRKYFGSGVLRDGRVYVVGGEYSDILGDTDKTSDNDTRAEIFDPVAGTWTGFSKPSPDFDFIVGDCVSIVLPDGRVMFGALSSSRTAIWDPDTGSWVESGTKFGTVANTKVGKTNEESWCLLPNGNVLTVQIFGRTATQDAEMYVPAEDQWVSAGTTASTLPVFSAGGRTLDEMGGAVTLPSGKAFFVGASGHTGVYTSGTTTTAQGTWTAGPDLPADASNPNAPAGLQTSSDGAVVLLPNGHLLLTSGTVDASAAGKSFSGPVTICDVDPVANTLSTPGNQPSSAPGYTWQCCFLLLPNGHVLMTGEQNTINEYVPDSAELTPKPSWRPVVTSAPTALIAGHSYQIGGTQLNGLSHANGYGDDRQNATNYPIARLTNAAGAVKYLRTRDFSTMGIATGTATVTAVMEVPANVLPGSWNLEVVANGIASAALPVLVGTRDCFLVMDRSIVGHGEVQALLALNGAPASFDPAVLVVVEGFTATELGLTAANLASPPVTPTFPDPAPGVHVVEHGAVLPEDPTLPPHVPQRFTFPCELQFDDESAFSFTGDTRDVTVTAAFTAAGQTVANSGVLRLLQSPNPYILDGDPARGVDWWTSIDMRVFQVTDGAHRFGATLAVGGSAQTAATNFIQNVITNLNSHPALGSDFDAVDPREAPEALTLAPTDGQGHRVFNFAVARVRFRDLNQDAPNVRAFFRMWPAQQTNAVHDTTTLYRTQTTGTRHVPLLGQQGDDIATVPFFASPRVDSSAVSMKTQHDDPNVRTIQHDSLGAEMVGWFGCWLDINQPDDLRFPARLLGTTAANLPDGPFQGVGPLLSIQQHVRSLHQCLIVELDLDGQTIPSWADPSTSDKLAQRNLTFVNVPNPGVVDSRVVPQTLQIRPTPAALLDDRPDELMIDWGNVPPGTNATLYLPTVDAAEALDWAHRMYVSNRLSMAGPHTLACMAGGVTYVPVPGASDLDHVGLLAVELPPTVHKGERYSVRVRQITGARFGTGRVVEAGTDVTTTRSRERRTVAVGAVEPAEVLRIFVEGSRQGFLFRRTIGAFGLEIPVSTKAILLPGEERTLSILRHIERTVPLESRWWPVFRRYVDLYAGRVAGMGGDPTAILPDGDGDWEHVNLCHDGHDRDRDEHDEHDGHDHEHGHDREPECDHADGGDRYTKTVAGKVVSLSYDHFGDFTGFVVETERDSHVEVRSTERRVEHLAREAWVTRAVVRVRLQDGDMVATLGLGGQVEE